MKKQTTRFLLSFIVLVVSLMALHAKASAAIVGTSVADGVDYSPVYNYEYYIQNNPDVARKFNGDDVATLNHFIEYGMNEGRQASASFDVHSYYLEYPDLRQAYGSDTKAYYLHYVNYGKNERRKATGVTQLVGTTVVDGVDYSAVYDYEYYQKNNPDVARKFNEDDVATLNHFIEYGMSEGRQASASFDVHSYYLEYPDLRRAYGSDMKAYYLHYVNYGENERRKATGVTQLVGTTVVDGVDYSAVYDYEYYQKNNPDVARKFNGDDVATLNYFIEYGMSEGCQASASFDVHSYYLEYPDLRQAYGSDMKAYYLHYVDYGKNEGRKATGVTQRVGTVTSAGGVDYSAVYDYDYYRQNNSDVAKAYNGDDVATLDHFIEYGMSEGRQASTSFDVHSYYLEYPDLRRAYRSDLKEYYLHYMNYGKDEKRIATGVTQLVPATVSDGEDYSAVYNYQYYIQNNSDVARACNGDDIAALDHFVEYGMSEGRQASDDFNVWYYRSNYSDLQQAYGNNMRMYYLHYVHYGKAEKRNGKNLWPDFTGWCTVRMDTYYYKNGSYCTGLQNINGKEYFFSDSGVLLSSAYGIDVSEHQSKQGAINWQQVKNSGVQFAMIRVGFGSDGDPTQDDSAAAYNISECERLGIPYGVYLFSYAISDDDARSEASHILRLLGGKHPSLGVYLDVEDNDYWDKKVDFNPFTHKDQVNRDCKIVMDTLKANGYSGQTGIYADLTMLRNVLDPNLFADNKLWLAQYYDTNSCPCAIWQYTSTGTVTGISGNVDLDILFP